MANTYNLGGSPLGLVNLTSRPTRDGMSTFNGGKSRNIKVFSYNTGSPQELNIKVSGDENVYAPATLLSGGSIPNFWPNADIDELMGKKDELGIESSQKAPIPVNGSINNKLHNDKLYDTSVLNIIERLSQSKAAALRPQDFAYCKNLGVYPNNRLMIARRFSGPISDNLYSKEKGTPPKSILISWKPEGEDFLDFSFGEEWTDADADFTNVLNKLGKNFGIDGGGAGLSKLINVIPLPGFTETLQRKVLESMGILSKDSSDTPLPSGNPNLIKMAKRRKTIDYSEAGSGLKASISVKMICEYEQKFISGIDPTVAWQDILNNIMIFGTSNSSDYGLSKNFVNTLNMWTKNPGTIITSMVDGITDAITELIELTKTEAAKLSGKKQETKDVKMGIPEARDKIIEIFNDVLESVSDTVKKYRVEVMGIAHALSGAPSTPWHITLGNPLRPIFSSGDMWINGDVKVTLGSVLAFNDLPSSIKVEFTLENARPLGMQEILAKFNAGNIKTVNIRKDFIENENFNDNTPAAGLYFNEVFNRNRKPLGGSDNISGTSSSANATSDQLPPITPGLSASATPGLSASSADDEQFRNSSTKDDGSPVVTQQP